MDGRLEQADQNRRAREKGYKGGNKEHDSEN